MFYIANMYMYIKWQAQNKGLKKCKLTQMFCITLTMVFLSHDTHISLIISSFYPYLFQNNFHIIKVTCWYKTVYHVNLRTSQNCFLPYIEKTREHSASAPNLDILIKKTILLEETGFVLVVWNSSEFHICFLKHFQKDCQKKLFIRIQWFTTEALLHFIFSNNEDR